MIIIIVIITVIVIILLLLLLFSLIRGTIRPEGSPFGSFLTLKYCEFEE